MLLSANGWAIVDSTGINVRTVSDTRRAAVVNWLVVEKGVGVYNSTSDEQIELVWTQLRGASEVMEVTIHKHLPDTNLSMTTVPSGSGANRKRPCK